MKKFAFTIIVLLASTAQAQNPAVCRVRTPEGNGVVSYGTGTCVASRDGLSLVITNYHVVQDHKGKSITVIFPSITLKAKIIGVDKNYDLAALIVKGTLPALKIARRKPVRGMKITLIGYARGEYREAKGKVNGFYTPGEGLPAHWFSVDHSSRSGDSGGPMLNEDGQLAGVLFGSNDKETLGTTCFKVSLFVNSLPKGQQ